MLFYFQHLIIKQMKKFEIEIINLFDFEEKKVKPKCKNCGHEICPHCEDWCDVVLYSKNDIGNHENVEDEDDYPALCCNSKCEIE